MATIKGKGYRLEMDTKAAERFFQKRLEAGAERAGQFLVGEVKKTLSKGQPTRKTVPRKTGFFGVPGSISRRVSVEKATPGAPPRVLLGRLRQSVDFDVRTSRGRVSLRVGAFTKDARRLELGWPVRAVAFFGFTGQGNAHPYLRPTIARHRRRLVQLMAGSRGRG